MTNFDVMKVIYHAQGAIAFCRGNAIERNPWAEGTEPSAAWEAGWRAAQVSAPTVH
jgi:hypothetical protein